MVNAIRDALRLEPYSEDISQRLTGRHFFTIDFVSRRFPKAGTILDVGARAGWFEYLMRERSSLEIVGVEPSANIDVSRDLAPGSRFVQGSALDLPFADESFDGAVMFEVIEHIPRGTEARALREISRVLKPGSPFALSTPFADPIATILDPIWYFGHRHYTKRKLLDLFERSGFEIESVTLKGGFGEILGTFALYFFKWVLRAETPAKPSLERARQKEYSDGYEGFSNIFIMARKAQASADSETAPR